VTKTGFSYGKPVRLRKRGEFLKVYAEGEKIRTQYFFLYRLKNELGRNRLGLTVSRKIGKTVIRNQLKRRLREIFRIHYQGMPPTYDLVINATRVAAKAPYKILERELLNAAGWHDEK
jgi:ribonuclease P protein component